ncbi:MAG: hypothetical protein HON04_08490, partial [Planctomicrobium sp.]|nr:hypothetical protein [Planctomicrobium sp.]
ILFEDAIGDRALSDFKRILAITKNNDFGAVLVLSGENADQSDSLNEFSPYGKALSQPIRLRDLRESLQNVIGMSVDS